MCLFLEGCEGDPVFLGLIWVTSFSILLTNIPVIHFVARVCVKIKKYTDIDKRT